MLFSIVVIFIINIINSQKCSEDDESVFYDCIEDDKSILNDGRDRKDDESIFYDAIEDDGIERYKITFRDFAGNEEYVTFDDQYQTIKTIKQKYCDEYLIIQPRWPVCPKMTLINKDGNPIDIDKEKDEKKIDIQNGINEVLLVVFHGMKITDLEPDYDGIWYETEEVDNKLICRLVEIGIAFEDIILVDCQYITIQFELKSYQWIKDITNLVKIGLYDITSVDQVKEISKSVQQSNVDETRFHIHIHIRGKSIGNDMVITKNDEIYFNTERLRFKNFKGVHSIQDIVNNESIEILHFEDVFEFGDINLLKLHNLEMVDFIFNNEYPGSVDTFLDILHRLRQRKNTNELIVSWKPAAPSHYYVSKRQDVKDLITNLQRDNNVKVYVW